MPNLESGDGEIQSNVETEPQTDVATERQVDSSPTETQNQYLSELKALRAQQERLREDLDRERENSRLLQMHFSQNSQKSKSPDDDEYADVDKTLGPWLERRLKPHIENFSRVLSDSFDKQDALSFMIDRINEDPELSERLNPGIPMDEIDRYRMKVAQSEGRYIKRNDALAVLRGMKSITEKKLSKTEKKQQAAKDEVIRQVSVEAANSGEDKPSLKPRGGVPPAVVKLRSGASLSDAERAEARKFLESQDAEV